MPPPSSQTPAAPPPTSSSIIFPGASPARWAGPPFRPVPHLSALARRHSSAHGPRVGSSCTFLVGAGALLQGAAPLDCSPHPEAGAQRRRVAPEPTDAHGGATSPPPGPPHPAAHCGLPDALPSLTHRVQRPPPTPSSSAQAADGREPSGRRHPRPPARPCRPALPCRRSAPASQLAQGGWVVGEGGLPCGLALGYPEGSARFQNFLPDRAQSAPHNRA